MWYRSLNDKIFHNHPGYRGKPRIMPISRIIIIIMSNRETSHAFRSRKFSDQKLSSKFSAFQNPIFESRNFSVDHVVIRVACVILTQLNVRNRIFRVLFGTKSELRVHDRPWKRLKSTFGQLASSILNYFCEISRLESLVYLSSTLFYNYFNNRST